MMKIITGSTGTAHVTSNNDGEFNQGIFGAGLVVLANGYHLEAQIKDANTITIKDGDLVFQGRHALIEPGTTEDVTIQTGSVGMNRNDLIVARYELDESTGYEKIILDVITGEESAGEPIDPAYVEGDIRTGALVAEVPLYRVKLSGININEVVPMFNFVPDLMGTVNQLKENLEGITIHRKKVNIEVNAGGVGFLGVAGFNNKDANIPFACYTINGVAIGSPTWGTIDNQWYIYSDTYKGKPLEVHVLYVRNVVDD